MNIYLSLDSYLAQWFIHDQGGDNPVRLRRGSIESAFLEQALTKPPADYVPELQRPGDVSIVLPQFKHIDTRTRFYLPPRGRDALIAIIRQRFDVEMWRELHKWSNFFLRRQDHLIYSFMEAHGIEMTETNFNAIAKRYQRKRDYYLRTKRRQNEKSSKSAKK